MSPGELLFAPRNGSKVGVTMDGKDMAIDLSEIKDPKARGRAERTRLHDCRPGTSRPTGVWEVEPGEDSQPFPANTRSDLDDCRPPGHVAGEVSGYTLEFIKGPCKEAQAASAANPRQESGPAGHGVWR